MKRLIPLAVFAVSSTGYADTYHYVGPTNPANGYHMEATLKVAGSLTPNTDYINAPANLGLISGSISVLDAAGNNAGASTPIPVSNWVSLRTNANRLPQYWVVGSNVNQVTTVNNDPATSNGPFWQAYTNYAPQGWAGYLANVDYEQYTYAIEYPVAQGCPAATPCNASTTTGTGLSIPTYSPFNYILNPTGSTVANWTLTPDAPVPPTTIQLSISTAFPAAMVGQAYTGNVTIANGTAPYAITVSGLPAGLVSNNGAISGTPTTAGTYTVTVNATDNLGDSGVTSASIVVAPAASCQGTSAIVSSTAVSKLFMTLANGQKVQYSNVYGSPGTTTFTYNGGLTAATAFTVGNIVTYLGTLDASTICVPSSLTFDVPAPVVPNCTAPAVLDTATNSCVIPPVVCVAPQVRDAATNTCVTPPPTALTCTKPAGATSAPDIHAKLTAVNGKQLTIGSKAVTLLDCAKVTYNGKAKAPVVGYDADSNKGYILNGVTYSTSIIIDDGK